MPERLWCEFELDWFDSAEFIDVPYLGVVHQREVNSGLLRHTIAGYVISDAYKVLWSVS
jgi:hypothetical protein